MFKIPTIMTSQEILDKAFRKAGKVQVEDREFVFRMRKLNIAKVESAADVIDTTLEKYIVAFPSFDRVPPFYIALMDLLHSIDDIRRILGRLNGVRKQIVIIKKKTNSQLSRTRNTTFMEMKRNEAFGRFSSMVNALDTDLRTLADVREKFKAIPSIPTSIPTAVVAGFPSVGKSQLVRSISTADPKVAPYPFTTQELIVGYFEEKRKKFQIIDTPGLLDRPFIERNPIEKQGVLALSLISSVCVYMLDPTHHCGFPLEPQLHLLRSLSESIPEMRFIVVVNKIDIKRPDGPAQRAIDEVVASIGERLIEYMDISSVEPGGLDALRELLIKVLEGERETERPPWEVMSDNINDTMI